MWKFFEAVDAVFHPRRVQQPAWQPSTIGATEPVPHEPTLSVSFRQPHNHSSTEGCVLCDRDTGVPMAMAISQRRHYVEGCGQFCATCYAPNGAAA
jgi:hypothetical protein